VILLYADTNMVDISMNGKYIPLNGKASI